MKGFELSLLFTYIYTFSGELFEGFLPLIGYKSIQIKNGDDGKKTHQLISRHFTHDAVGGYFDCLVEVCHKPKLFHVLFFQEGI